MAAVCVVVGGRAPAQAMDEPPGSYQASCLSIRTSGNYLYARCEDISGGWHPAQLDLNRCPRGPVANNNGVLVCGPGGYGISNRLPRGSWRATCRNASKEDGTLYAECATSSGSWRNSSLDLDNCPSRLVGNSSGNLFCQGGGGYYSGNLPPGSWRTTCRNGRMEGSVVYAECYDGHGNWRQASIDTRRCNAALGNSHGVLVCENGRGMYRRQ